MTSTRLARFRRSLLAWYDRVKRDLPWRRTADPYRIWLSETMLQQTQVARVVDYYRRFLDEFPDVFALADAPEDRVLKAWEGLGYYSRARNLHRAAKRIVAEHAGHLPASLEELKALPGFGEYTAAAVASIAFGEIRAVIDGNVTRVAARLRADDIGDSLQQQKAVVADFTRRAISRKRPGDFNQAMMELGATVCAPRTPDCANCPVSGECQAFGTKRQSLYPLKKAKPLRPTIEEAGILLENGKYLLLRRRTGEKLLGGLWEFPTSPLKTGEAPEAAAARLLADQFGITGIAVLEPVAELKHVFTHFIQKLRVFSGTVHIEADPAGMPMGERRMKSNASR